VPGVRTVLSTTGGGFLALVNSGTAYVRIAPHGERIFSLTRLLAGLVRLDPMSAFRGNYSQREIMQRIRQALRAYPDLRTGVRNIQSFNIGGGNAEFDFVIRGPDLARLSEYGEALRARAPELGLLDADITLKILQVDHARTLRAQGVELGAAVLQASRDRLRPILMTTLALVGGMLPLALGSGPGAEERRAIAVVVIGGQSLSLFLTLIVTPVAFYAVEALRARLGVQPAVAATA